MEKRFNFTEARLRALPPSQKERDEYYDEQVKSLQLRVYRNGNKVFYFYKKIKALGKPKPVRLGKWDEECSIRDARERASDYANIASKGGIPGSEYSERKGVITLDELYHKFIEDWVRPHRKAKTLSGYESTYRSCLQGRHILNRKLCDINTHDIAKIFTSIGKEHPVAANRFHSLISVMFNKAISWGIYDKNPVESIDKFEEVRRERSLESDEVAAFFNALRGVQNEIHRDFFYIKLFVGNRRTKVLSMHQSDLDLVHGFWKIGITKNGKPHRVSLTNKVVDRIKHRIKRNLEMGFTRKNGFDEGWIFPSPSSKSGHLEEPKKSWYALLEKAAIKNFHMHDLRHTMGSWMNDTGSDAMIIKSMLGHDDIQSTQLYVHPNSNVVRMAAERAQTAILKLANEVSICRASLLYMVALKSNYSFISANLMIKEYALLKQNYMLEQ